MLQLARLNRRAERSLREDGTLRTAWRSMADLEATANEAVAQLRTRRQALAGPVDGLRHRLDAAIYTETTEYMDRDDYPDSGKVRLVRQLHRLNQAILSYARFMRVLRPHVTRLHTAHGRPARLLELASGAGEFSMQLARRAAQAGLPVEVTGSDIQRAYVERNNEVAVERELPVRFRHLNAFDLSDVMPSEFDLLFVTQSVHHFTPGQLAMMIAQGRRAGADTFVAVDGRRTLLLLGFVPVFQTALSLATQRQVDGDFIHDGIISARRFYSEPELSLIARIAAPHAHVTVQRNEPAYSVLTVRYR